MKSYEPNHCIRQSDYNGSLIGIIIYSYVGDHYTEIGPVHISFRGPMSIRPWNSLSSYYRDMRTLARRIGPIQITPGKGSPIDTVRFDRSRCWNLR